MLFKISKVIESDLRFLKLTRSGKIRLTAFSDDVLLAAKKDYNRLVVPPEVRYATFFAACMLQVQAGVGVADWSPLAAATAADGFDEDGAVTLENELFDNDAIADAKQNLKSLFTQSPRFNKPTVQGNSRYTFTSGLRYYINGEDFGYPDQAIHEGTNPRKKENNPRKFPKLSWEERANLDKVSEFKKAIQTGRMNKEGLRALLSADRVNDTEIQKLARAYLDGTITPENVMSIADDTQMSIGDE